MQLPQHRIAFRRSRHVITDIVDRRLSGRGFQNNLIDILGGALVAINVQLDALEQGVQCKIQHFVGGQGDRTLFVSCRHGLAPLNSLGR
jgi:hypothetical protein